jgi:calcineurin-like phosphoesterase family protein
VYNALITADLHFGQSEIIDSHIIKNWNSRAKDDDDVFVLGDVSSKYTGEQIKNIVSRLRGRKYLIRGNHDVFIKESNAKEFGFEWAKDYYVLECNGYRLIMNHYPVVESIIGDSVPRGAKSFDEVAAKTPSASKNDFLAKNAVSLYGHVHWYQFLTSRFFANHRFLCERAINVSINMNKFRLLSVGEICGMAFDSSAQKAVG